MRHLRSSVIAAVALFMVSGTGQAATRVFNATLNGTSEVPPTTSTGTGTATATLNTATRKLTWDVTYSGLSGPAKAAHIHGPAAAGKERSGRDPVHRQSGQPDQRLEDIDRGADGKSRSRNVLREYPYRRQSARRNSRSTQPSAIVRTPPIFLTDPGLVRVGEGEPAVVSPVIRIFSAGPGRVEAGLRAPAGSLMKET